MALVTDGARNLSVVRRELAGDVRVSSLKSTGQRLPVGGFLGTLATSIRRIEAMKYAAYNKADAEKVVKAATHGNTKASYYKWSPSALDVDRMKEHELYHSAPFRH